MPPAIQQPLLPLRRDGGPTSPAPGLPARRPASQHTSPAKEILTAVEQGNAAGALRAAAAACLRSPLLLLAAVATLLCAAGLTAWLLPQQQLPTMLAHVSQRERSEWSGVGKRLSVACMGRAASHTHCSRAPVSGAYLQYASQCARCSCNCSLAYARPFDTSLWCL